MLLSRDRRKAGKNIASVIPLILLVILTTFVHLSAQSTTNPNNPAESNSPAGFASDTTLVTRYLQTAAENNPALKASYNQYLAALQQVPQVGALPDPELAFGYFISPIETRVGPQSARFSLSQMFPWFGTLNAREQAETNQAKAKFEAFQSARNRLFYKVKSTWYELYVLHERLKILEENIEILESLETLALQKLETAQGSQPDVLQVQIELEDLRITRSNLLEDRQVLRQTFRELLNSDTVDFPETMMVNPVDLPESQEVLHQQLMEQNPALNELENRELAAEQSIRAAELNGLPKFGVGIDYILTDQRDISMSDNGKDAFLARAAIQIPLFRKKYNAQKRQAEIQQGAVRQQQTAKQNELLTELERALRNYHNATRRLNLYQDKQISRTRQAINILTEEYASANTDFEEILRLQRRLLEYQRAREEALASQNKAIAQIEMLTGHYNIQPNDRREK